LIPCRSFPSAWCSTPGAKAAPAKRIARTWPFSETAARRLLGPDITGVPCRTFEDMFASIGSGAADCCMAPIENSLAGSIHRNYDLLLQSDLSIAGETSLRIVHNLIAPPGVELAAIRRVYSHPVALAQCTRFFSANPNLEPIAVHDTAGAVRLVMEHARKDEAAIASATAAEIYPAKRCRRHRRQPAELHAIRSPCRKATSKNHAGRDAKRWKTPSSSRDNAGRAFPPRCFAIFEIDLTKIESRPIEGSRGSTLSSRLHRKSG
jgi:prephenate dehydratase